MQLQQTKIDGSIADESDRATFVESLHNEEAIARAITQGAPRTSPEFDGENCIDCDEAIEPKQRISLGYQTCIHCQSLMEKRGKTMGLAR